MKLINLEKAFMDVIGVVLCLFFVVIYLNILYSFIFDNLLIIYAISKSYILCSTLSLIGLYIGTTYF